MQGGGVAPGGGVGRAGYNGMGSINGVVLVGESAGVSNFGVLLVCGGGG